MKVLKQVSDKDWCVVFRVVQHELFTDVFAEDVERHIVGHGLTYDAAYKDLQKKLYEVLTTSKTIDCVFEVLKAPKEDTVDDHAYIR